MILNITNVNQKDEGT